MSSDSLPVTVTCVLAVVAGIGLLWVLTSAFRSSLDRRKHTVVPLLRRQCDVYDRAQQELKSASDSWSDSWVNVPAYQFPAAMQEFADGQPPAPAEPEGQEGVRRADG